MLLDTDRLRDNELYIGAIEEEMAVGAGRFSGAEDVLVVDSIFVLPDHRRMGIGRSMLEAVEETASSSGASSVWVGYAGSEEADSFLRSMGFALHEDCGFYKVPVTDIVESKMAKDIFLKMKETDDDKLRICSFEKLSSSQLNSIKNRLVEMGLADVDGMISSLSNPANSIAVFKDAAHKEISAVMLLDVIGDYVTIKYLANLGGIPKDLVYILKLFWGMLISRKLTDKMISFCTAESEIKRIIAKFVGGEVRPTGNMMVAYKQL